MNVMNLSEASELTTIMQNEMDDLIDSDSTYESNTMRWKYDLTNIKRTLDHYDQEWHDDIAADLETDLGVAQSIGSMFFIWLIGFAMGAAIVFAMTGGGI